MTCREGHALYSLLQVLQGLVHSQCIGQFLSPASPDFVVIKTRFGLRGCVLLQVSMRVDTSKSLPQMSQGVVDKDHTRELSCGFVTKPDLRTTTSFEMVHCPTKASDG